jgi:adenylate cyclase
MVIRISTFLFVDLCGYTEYTWRHGDDLSAEVATGFHAVVRKLAPEEGCEFVKAVGDGAMIRADECDRAIVLADRLIESSAGLGYPPLRAGIDTGPAVACEGDWYGTTVNTAARVADAASPGEVLVTDRAREAALIGSIDTVSTGAHSLKGLPECVLHAARLPAAELCA